MPTFAAFWNALDIIDRMKLGLLPKRDLPTTKAQRRKLKTALVQFLQRKRCLPLKKRFSTAAVFRGCAACLGRSNAGLVLLNLEDLWGETQSQNTPGTSTERKNWVRKLPYSLEQIQKSKRLQRLLKSIRDEQNRRPQSPSRSPNYSRRGAPGRGNRRRKIATKPRSALLDINSTGENPLAQAQ
jgi:4-alpha-glucanotransferase